MGLDLMIKQINADGDYSRGDVIYWRKQDFIWRLFGNCAEKILTFSDINRIIRAIQRRNRRELAVYGEAFYLIGDVKTLKTIRNQMNEGTRFVFLANF